MSSHLAARPIDFWLARSSVVAIVALQLLVVSDLSLGPRWLAPSLELALLAPLSIATAWNLDNVRKATTEHHWFQISRQRHWIRLAAVLLTALISVMNFGALASLVRDMFGGHARNAQTLLLDALNIWGTNLIAFALWYWNMDRGGPACRGLVKAAGSDFLFPQHTLGDPAYQGWRPGFVDYLFLAFATATAFSPSDVLPLTARAKLLMMLQAMISLITVALVASRAVGILQ
jgi:hypothetical protein